MLTYQDFLRDSTTEEHKQDFVLKAINYHKTTELYKRAYLGYKYYCNENVTISNYIKWLHTALGEKVKDVVSPNHKCANGFFREFIRQENECLLSNGVNFKDDKTKDKIGGSGFDIVLKKLGKAALWGGVSFGFFNLDHIQPFTVLEFVPLYDEETGALMAGIYFWQIDVQKPLRATLYEIDGYTDYIYNTDDNRDGILNPKRTYKINLATARYTGTEILNGENYSGFPIVPFWGNPEHRSEFTESLQNNMDAYDLVLSGFANVVDETSEIYWTLQNVGGMDEKDAVNFRDMVHRLKVAYDMNGEGTVQPNTIDIPSNARQVLLERLRDEMYTAYGAVDYTRLSTHSATATEIKSAYTSLNYKVSDYETCVIEFIKGILELAGVDDEPSFSREQIVNSAEEIDNVLKCAQFLPQGYLTTKLLTLLGDIDQLDDVQREISETEAARMELIRAQAAEQDTGGNEENGRSEEADG